MPSLQPAPWFRLDDLAWYSTDVVVATEGEVIDGTYRVLEVWRGDLTPGVELKLPWLKHLATTTPDRLSLPWSLRRADVPDGVLKGERVILFLRGREDEAPPPSRDGLGSSAPRSRFRLRSSTQQADVRLGERQWEHAAAYVSRVKKCETALFPASVAWVKDGRVYCFKAVGYTIAGAQNRIRHEAKTGRFHGRIRTSETSTLSALCGHRLSEHDFREKVRALNGLKKPPTGEFLVDPSPDDPPAGEEAQLELSLPTDGGFALFTDNAASLSALRSDLEAHLKQFGPEAVAEALLRGEPEEVATLLVSFLEKEIHYWRLQSRGNFLNTLDRTWWDHREQSAKEHVHQLYRRYVIARELARALGERKCQEARKILQELPSLWKTSLDFFEGSDPLRTVTDACRIALLKIEFGKEEAQAREGEYWLERAEHYAAKEGHEFLAALHAARAIGFEGFGRARQSEAFQRRYPVLLPPGSPDYQNAKDRVTQLSQFPRPVLRVPLGKIIATSKDGQQLVSREQYHRLAVWSRETGALQATLQSQFSLRHNPVRFGADETELDFRAGQDGGIWNLETGEVRSAAEEEDESDFVRTLRSLRKMEGADMIDGSFWSFNTDGNYAAARFHSAAMIRIWDRRSGRKIRELPGHPGGTFSTAFSADETLLASSGADGRVVLWTIPDGTSRALEPYSEPVQKTISSAPGLFWLTFSPDGTRLAGVHRTKDCSTLRVWDVDSGEQSHAIVPPDSYDIFLAFGPDSRTLIYGARVWDLGDGTVPDHLDLAEYFANDWTGIGPQRPIWPGRAAERRRLLRLNAPRGSAE